VQEPVLESEAGDRMTYKQSLIELGPSIWQALLARSIPAAPNVLPFQSHGVANNAFPPPLSPTPEDERSPEGFQTHDISSSGLFTFFAFVSLIASLALFWGLLIAKFIRMVK
jgi:hypothetical protein